MYNDYIRSDFVGGSMLKTFHRFLFIGLVIFGHSAMAYQGTKYRVGAAYDRIRFSEALMDEQGWLPGIYGAVQWVYDYPYALNARIDYFQGNLMYNGSTVEGTPILNNKTKDWIRNTELVLDIRSGVFVFHIGVAQRVWNDDLVISYNRLTTYYYLPVGFTVYDPSGFYFTALQNYFLIGENVSQLSQVRNTPPYNDVEMKQRSGTGFKLEAGWRERSASTTNYEFAVYYQEWRINASDTAQSGGREWVEPKNKTDILGFNLGVSF